MIPKRFKFFDADAPPVVDPPDPVVDPPPVGDTPISLTPTDGDPPPSLESNATYDWEADSAELGKVELPEGITIAGREVKGSVKDLIDSAEERTKGLRQLLNDKGYTAPEEYAVAEDSMWGKEEVKEVIAPVFELFKTLDMTQAQADGMMEMLGDFQASSIEAATKANELDLVNHWNLTGEAFKEHLGKVNAWANENLPAETFKQYATMGTAGVIAAENAMLRNSEQGIYKGPTIDEVIPGVLSTDEVSTLQMGEAYSDNRKCLWY